ncbi:phosphoribosylanthranilate isomerase [Gimesia algae]|uniref:N-(5'-phosphoribosyl)anthranilate isomerase n=1 Tax=Gimesia algae TaxID=2527971 RepID=A0A517VFY0_9PLAN|nr:phosphoribosylanthranilate isomerase [Gimesia algae]QDT91926.1 N-(5'-phosphoribosyl)anthranilate isomerase [Gimesia algae]
MWIKICGIQDPETACMVADLGATALGLNFYSPSPRSIDLTTAKEIQTAIGPRAVTLVGLFVNHSLLDVITVCDALNLNMIQLHGEEPPEFLAELAHQFSELTIIKAIRTRDSDLSFLESYLKSCDRTGKRPDHILIDAYSPAAYGGTGHLAPWQMISEEYQYSDWPKLILAGGLTPENVAEAIGAVHPFGVDTASGVENQPGVKNRAQVEAFINQAKK